MLRHSALRIALAISLCIVLFLSATVGRAAAPSVLRLRRTTFDPLQRTPIISSLERATRSSLQLVQLKTAPDETTPARLQADGLRPLLYVPDNAFLVRVRAEAPSVDTSLIRWSGPFEPAYKLSPELDPLLHADDATLADVRLIATPDADIDALIAVIKALGGTVSPRSAGSGGASLRAQIPATALRPLLNRDDVVWIEPTRMPYLHNDKGRAIMGVDQVRQQFDWLTGKGQIVAVTDTGLDVQDDVLSGKNPDFAGRIEQGFSNSEMTSTCSGDDWSDRNGHGTHVAGTILGSGALSPSGFSFAGVAPEAQLVVQSVSSGGNGLDCLDTDNVTFLSKAYETGARVQNGSWGSSTKGAYNQLAQSVDAFLWDHKDHLFVVSAGNDGVDANPRDGVVDPQGIESPATAKNVLAVGATESYRPPTTANCSASSGAPPENHCWTVFSSFANTGAPFNSDFISNNIDGMAAFSSRGPASDGRIKPEIVAPGVNIISDRSHFPGVDAQIPYDNNYAYDSGTSMSAPMVSGLAVLVRQWLAHDRGLQTPSAALIKALLLNGATNISPGQYGTGVKREIPEAWPNNVEGWGRASLTDTIGLNSASIWLHDEPNGLQTGSVATYTLNLDQNQPSLHVTLAWTDFPATPFVDRTLVNDLDLEVQSPDGSIFKGNMTADIATGCRDANEADRCNNVESIEIAAPQNGTYTLRVRGHAIPQGPQPFALVTRVDHSNAVSQEVPLHKEFLPLVSLN